MTFDYKDFAGKRLWATTSFNEQFSDHEYKDGLNVSSTYSILFGITKLYLNDQRIWIREVTLCEDSKISLTSWDNKIYKTTKAIISPRRLLTREIIDEIYGKQAARDAFLTDERNSTKLYKYENPTLDEVKKAIRVDKENILLLPSYSYDLAELYIFAMKQHKNATKYITNPSPEIQELINEYALDVKTIINMSPDQIRKLYKQFGPSIMYYTDNVPDDIQLDMINKDPALIWYISNPIPEVIARAQKVPKSIWSIPECYYSPVFNFKQEFNWKRELDYKQFCLEVKRCSGYVSSICILSYLIGDTSNRNSDINVIIQGDENASKFSSYLLENKYTIRPPTYTIDQALNLSRTRIVFDPPSPVDNSHHIIITTTRCHPLSFIMNASLMDSYRVAFDGEGLWTAVKFQGQDITQVMISEYAFMIVALTNAYKSQYSQTIINDLESEINVHCNATTTKNVNVGNRIMFNDYIKREGRTITHTPKIEY